MKRLTILFTAICILLCSCQKAVPEPVRTAADNPLTVLMPETRASSAGALEGTVWYRCDGILCFSEDASAHFGRLFWFAGGVCKTCEVHNIDGVFYRRTAVESCPYLFDLLTFRVRYGFGPGELTVVRDTAGAPVSLRLDGYDYLTPPVSMFMDKEYIIVGVNIHVTGWENVTNFE